MNRKQLRTLIVVLAILGIAGVMLYKKQSASWSGGGAGEGEKVLADVPVGEELAQFVITHGSNTVTLAKKDGTWRVKERDDYPANFSEISRVVLKLRDLKAAQSEPIGPSQLERLELESPDSASGAGTLVEFRDTNGQALASLLLGKQQMRKDNTPSQFAGTDNPGYPIGRWVLNPKRRNRAALVPDPLSNLEPKPQSWLDKEFFKVAKPRSIAVTYAKDPTNSFKLTRETESGPWTLADAQPDETLDSSKTSSFNYALSNPSFNDVIVDPDPAKLGLDQPTVVRIDTFDGFNYELKAGKKTNNTIPLRVAVKGTYARERKAPENEEASVKTQKDKEFANTLKTRDEKLAKEQGLEKWIYSVSSWTLDSVLKKRSDLVKAKEEKKPVAAKTEAPADPTKELLNLPSSK